MATDKNKIEEIELTEEENKGQLRTYENDILKGLSQQLRDGRGEYPADRMREISFFFFRY